MVDYSHRMEHVRPSLVGAARELPRFRTIGRRSHIERWSVNRRVLQMLVESMRTVKGSVARLAVEGRGRRRRVPKMLLQSRVAAEMTVAYRIVKAVRG